MEQIHLENVIGNECSRWSEDDACERNQKLTKFPNSIVVATSYMEIDFVEEWLNKTIGPKGINWEFLFYYKQDYDFGYAEYFFSEENSSITFKNQLPKIYGLFPNGKKFRTNYKGEYLKLK